MANHLHQPVISIGAGSYTSQVYFIPTLKMRKRKQRKTIQSPSLVI